MSDHQCQDCLFLAEEAPCAKCDGRCEYCGVHECVCSEAPAPVKKVSHPTPYEVVLSFARQFDLEYDDARERTIVSAKELVAKARAARAADVCPITRKTGT